MGHRSRTAWVALLAIGVCASASAPARAQGGLPAEAEGTHSGGAPPAPAPPSPHGVARRASREAPDATLPGFETLADGSTRLFVELSRPVAYEAKVARGSITYVLKGVRVDRRNNRNPLVTVHFNTPVTSARLVPHGRDVWFVVDLRAAVNPSVVIDPGKDGGAMLRIEFPKGQYLPPMAAPGDATPGAPSAAGAASSDESQAR